MIRFREFSFTALLILLAAGVGPATSQVWRWSHTSDNNANSDPSINWSEGQSPSSVNDSARAMMAQIANYRDDISGLLTTGGSSTAYTVTTNSGLCPSSSTPTDGQLLSITINSTNGVNPTLTADSCSAFPIQSSAGVAVASATLISGSPYSMRFSVANSAWMLKGFYSNPTVVALGMMPPFTGTVVPNSNFVFPAGQCLSTTTYAAYWVLVGSPASTGCSGGQFKIIDMSGRVPAGLDTMPGFSAAGRLTNSATGCGTAMTTVGAACANGNEGSAITLAQLPTGITSSYSATAGSGLNIPSNTNAISEFDANITGGGTVRLPFVNSAGVWSNNVGLSVSGTATSNNTSGTTRPNVPPIVGVTYLLRVL